VHSPKRQLAGRSPGLVVPEINRYISTTDENPHSTLLKFHTILKGAEVVNEVNTFVDPIQSLPHIARTLY
jgi:hypothetical protein